MPLSNPLVCTRLSKENEFSLATRSLWDCKTLFVFNSTFAHSVGNQINSTPGDREFVTLASSKNGSIARGKDPHPFLLLLHALGCSVNRGRFYCDKKKFLKGASIASAICVRPMRHSTSRIQHGRDMHKLPSCRVVTVRAGPMVRRPGSFSISGSRLCPIGLH